MKRLFLASTIAASWISLSDAECPRQQIPALCRLGTCAGLTGLPLPNAQILSTTQTTGYCNVVGIINKRVSAQNTDHFTYGIGFSLNLPNTWFGRFEAMGKGD